MAPKSSLICFIALVVVLSTLMSSTKGRKLLVAEQRRNGFPAVDAASLYLAAAVRQHSYPSKKGEAADTIDEKLNARHLSAVRRVLVNSHPSPGMGH